MTQSWNSWCWQLGLVSFLAIGGAIAFSGDWAFAENTPDATLEAEPFVFKPIDDQDDTNAVGQNNVLRSMSLKCYRTTGNAETDQISLEVDYQPAWGPYPMKAGDGVNLINVIPIHYSARIEFFVHDANGTKTSLGSRRVLATRGKPFTFNRNGAYYTLTYEVEEQNYDY